MYYLVMFACGTIQGGCTVPAPRIPDDAMYATSCSATALKNDGTPDDNAPDGQCSIDIAGNVVTVTVRGNASGYFIVLNVNQPDQSPS